MPISIRLRSAILAHIGTIQKVTGNFGILSLRKGNVDVSKEGDIQGINSKLVQLEMSPEVLLTITHKSNSYY